ncbi:MAG: GAF domain-containing protein, partial [Quisquiliibacterium sp.]
ITPWLNEARRARNARLYHGPAGASKSEQRSCLICALRVRGKAWGFLYADTDGVLGRFEEPERALFAALAEQATAALANMLRVEQLQSQIQQRASEWREQLALKKA